MSNPGMQNHYPNCSFYDEYIDRYPKKAEVRTVTFTKITVLTWSECNYRISDNADISTVFWQSARGFYSKIILSEGMPVDSSLSLYSIFNSLRREL